jgi:hypothetical protein
MRPQLPSGITAPGSKRGADVKEWHATTPAIFSDEIGSRLRRSSHRWRKGAGDIGLARRQLPRGRQGSGLDPILASKVAAMRLDGIDRGDCKMAAAP